jgi:uncharacterized protein (AIM24 family)
VLVRSGQELDGQGIRVRIHGELVPIAEVGLAGGEGVYFEHHIVLSKDPSVELAIHPLGRGLARRLLGGLPLILLRAHGSGTISFSRDGVGQMVAINLGGEAIDVMEHRFICASDQVRYGYQRVRGLFNMFGSGTGFWMDRFEGTGIVLLHAYGNVVERTLGAGEEVDVEPGSWLYKDPEVHMQMHVVSLRQGLFASAQGFTMARFRGPGRIAYQSLTPVLEVQSGE